MSTLDQSRSAAERVPIEVWVELFTYVGNISEIAKYRHVSRQWSLAGAVSMMQKKKSMLIAHEGELIQLNAIISLSPHTELFTNFEINPRALLAQDANLAVTRFLELVGSTVKSYSFEPLHKTVQELYEIDVASHGRLLTQFLSQSPYLTSIKINFQDSFSLPPNCFEILPAFEELRHITAIFPYKYCRYDEYMVLIGICNRAPRLTQFDLSFLLKRGGPKPRRQSTKTALAQVLEVLIGLKPTVKIGLQVKPDTVDPVHMDNELLTMTEYSKLSNQFILIDIHVPFNRTNSNWNEVLWRLAVAQAESLVTLKLTKEGVLPNDFQVKQFPNLQTLIVPRMNTISNTMLATAFQTLRILKAGIVRHSSVMFQFVRRLTNLEELSLCYTHRDSWFAITGEELPADVASSGVLMHPWMSNCDRSPSPFMTLKKLKILTISADKNGLFGLLHISKQNSLNRLDKLTHFLSFGNYMGNLMAYRQQIPATARRECLKQLQSYHRNAAIVTYW